MQDSTFKKSESLSGWVDGAWLREGRKQIYKFKRVFISLFLPDLIYLYGNLNCYLNGNKLARCVQGRFTNIVVLIGSKDMFT